MLEGMLLPTTRIEALIRSLIQIHTCMMQATWLRRGWQLTSPQRDTGAPSDHLACAHSAELAARSCETREIAAPEHRRLFEVGHG